PILPTRRTRISGGLARSLPTALPIAGALRPGRPLPILLDRGGRWQHVELLCDLHQIGRRPVDDEAGREAEPDESKEDRHDPGEHLLLLVLAWRRPLHLTLLVIGR